MGGDLNEIHNYMFNYLYNTFYFVVKVSKENI